MYSEKPSNKQTTNTTQAHIRDGAALVAFFAWLERALAVGEQGAKGEGLAWCVDVFFVYPPSPSSTSHPESE